MTNIFDNIGKSDRGFKISNFKNTFIIIRPIIFSKIWSPSCIRENLNVGYLYKKYDLIIIKLNQIFF